MMDAALGFTSLRKREKGVESLGFQRLEINERDKSQVDEGYL